MTAPRLLIVVNVFNPDRGGGGAIFSDLAYGLAARGFDVTVRCAYPYYPEWQDKSGQNGWRIQRYDDHGAHVERHWLYIPRNPNSLFERMLYEASFFLSLLRSLFRGPRFDAVMVFCPLVGAVGYAALHRLVYRTPIWLNVQDLSADAAAAGGIAKGPILPIMRAVQRFLFNRAGLWSSISPVMLDRLRPLRDRGQPLLYLPNWLNASMADAVAACPPKAGRLPGGPIRLLYAGNIGAKQDLLEFCRILHASDARFHFRVHGNGGRAGEVRDWIAAANDARFAFGDFMEEPDFARALHDTDFFVITEKTGSGGSFIPCKTISGLASGTPILAVCDHDSPLGLEMREAQPGPAFSWDRAREVPALLDALQRDPAPFHEWQRNAAARAAFYAREGVIGRFAAALEAFARGEMPAGG